MMQQVAVRELKAQLSLVLAQARAGQVIEVRSHNVPIARIVGIPQMADEPLRRLMAECAVSWNGRKPALSASVTLSAGGVQVSNMVIEDRG